MNRKITKPEDWANEFHEFVASDAVQPPRELSAEILSKVHADLNPATWLVLSKLAFIHVLVGAFTLLVCPQFGVGAFGGMGLMHVFMRFGETVCTLACGAFFLGSSTLVGSLIMRPEEVKIARAKKIASVLLLSGISVGAFICTGAEMIANLALLWALGSMTGGIATLELGWLIRSRFRQRILHGV
jgi:hypothetical protein